MYREDRNGQHARKKTVSESSIAEIVSDGECTDASCGHVLVTIRQKITSYKLTSPGQNPTHLQLIDLHTTTTLAL
jgi:hypothetical protein